MCALSPEAAFPWNGRQTAPGRIPPFRKVESDPEHKSDSPTTFPFQPLRQIAGVPERHEPDTGEVNYPYLFRLLDELGYDGWLGCEYRPAQGTVEGLGWRQEG